MVADFPAPRWPQGAATRLGWKIPRGWRFDLALEVGTHKSKEHAEKICFKSWCFKKLGEMIFRRLKFLKMLQCFSTTQPKPSWAQQRLLWHVAPRGFFSTALGRPNLLAKLLEFGRLPRSAKPLAPSEVGEVFEGVDFEWGESSRRNEFLFQSEDYQK